MATTIVTKSGSGAPTASDLVAGELAVDLTNGRLYTEDSGGTVLEIGLNPSGNVNITGTATMDGLTVSAPSGDTPASIVTTTGGSFLQFTDTNTTAGRSPLVGAITDDMVFYTSAGSYSEKVRINAAGNVGIGVAPEAWTAFNPVLRIKNASTGGGGALAGSGVDNFRMFANTYYDGAYKRLGVGFATQYGQESGQHVWSYAASGAADSTFTWSEAMRIDSSGNVGIGTSSLTGGNTILNLSRTGSGVGCNMQFANSHNGAFYVGLAGNTTGDAILHSADGTAGMAFGTGNTERMRINSSGNVGIGTSLPTNKLSLYKGIGYGSDSALYSDIGINDTSVDNGGVYQWRTGITGNNGGHSYTLSSIARGGSYTERLRVDNGGNLLVGTSSGSATSGVGIKIVTDSTAPYVNVVGSASTNSSYGYYQYSTGASAFRFYVGYGGTIFATSTSITAISDASLKENVRDLDKGLETILALQPRRFDWKNGDGKDIMGFVAQEVETILPELVHDYQYNDEETKLGLKMGDMVPSLVKAIQEQQATIETLTARIAALES